MEVSFIIPVYKVEQYLYQCVESISSQTYRDIEIILVDDGSPDGCPALCDSLAAEDDRINVVHKENGGLSDARNAGLKAATGDYVVFVDGDDFWKNATNLDNLMSVVGDKPECDFVGFNCQYYYPDSDSFRKWVEYSPIIENQSVDKNAAMIELVKSGTFPMSACLKIMKRHFLIDNELFFVKGQLSEDIPWFINMLDCTDKCCFVNEYVYCYRQNVSGSITNTSGSKGFNNLFSIFKSELGKVDDRSFNEEAKNALRSFLAYEYSILLTYNIKEKKVLSELYQYKNVLRYTTNPKVRMVSKVNNFLGVRITRRILRMYEKMRNSKK